MLKPGNDVVRGRRRRWRYCKKKKRVGELRGIVRGLRGEAGTTSTV